MREIRVNPSDTRTYHPVLSFLAFTVFFQAMGGLMGWITSHGIDEWYQTLEKSPLNPPDAVFGIVWTMLYLLLSYAAWTVWRAPPSTARTKTIRLFSVHMVMNWAWSPLFFAMHALLPSFLLILVLVFTAALLTWMIAPINKKAAAVFVPYLAWLAFAGHLSYYIWQQNS